MKKIIISLVVLAMMATGCQAPDDKEEKPVVTQEQKTMVDARNELTFKLLNKIYSQDVYANMAISGISAHVALSMVANGAQMPCLTEILSTLGIDKINITDVNLQNRTFLGKAYGEDIEMVNSNSMWVGKDANVVADFSDTMKKSYNAAVEPIDFADEKSPDKINDWVSKSTNGKISKLVTYEEIKDALLMLINALYLKAPWTEQFEVEATSDKDFTKLDGSKKSVRMMTRTGFYRYRRGEGFGIARIPFGKNEELAMYVVLPDAAEGLVNLIDFFDRENFELQLLKMKGKELQLSMPKVKFEFETDLVPMLKKLGMVAVFDPSTSDLSGMVSNPSNAYISLIKHKTFIDVHEGGIEAAAVTAVEMVAGAAPGEEGPEEFVVDHPYMFLIRDEVSGDVLFASCVTNP
jgi:serpin B